MLLFSNYVRIGITTALVTHNLFQWPVPIHGTEKAWILYLCPRLEFRDFFSEYERLAFVYLGCQSKVSAWSNTGNSTAKATVKQTNDVVFIPQTQM